MSFTNWRTTKVLADVAVERSRQDEKWGSQRDHLDGTGFPGSREMSDEARDICDAAFTEGRGSWTHILTEEFFEAMAETDPIKLREELVQVAAVATVWVEAIDARVKA